MSLLGLACGTPAGAGCPLVIPADDLLLEHWSLGDDAVPFKDLPPHYIVSGVSDELRVAVGPRVMPSERGVFLGHRSRRRSSLSASPPRCTRASAVPTLRCRSAPTACSLQAWKTCSM